jgi:hypothetical protein
MTLEGIVRNGVVVYDGTGILAEGTRVKVVVVADEANEPTFAGLLELAGTVNDLPPDLARNHNHYLHGHPKK